MGRSRKKRKNKATGSSSEVSLTPKPDANLLSVTVFDPLKRVERDIWEGSFVARTFFRATAWVDQEQNVAGSSSDVLVIIHDHVEPNGLAACFSNVVTIDPACNTDEVLSLVLQQLSTLPQVCIPWPELVYRASLRSGDRIALMCGDQSCSYKQFMSESIEIRDFLIRTIGLGPGVHVLVSHTDEPQSWLTWARVQLALGLLNCPFTMLDTAMPAAGRDHVVNIFKPTVYIQCSLSDPSDFLSDEASDSLACHIQLMGSERVAVRNKGNLYKKGAGALGAFKDFWCLSSSKDIAFVDWTSGSSGGVSKGVECTFRMLTNQMLGKWSDYRAMASVFPESKRASQEPCPVGTSLFNLWYWWGPLCMGSYFYTVLLRSEEVRDLQLFCSAIDKYKLRVINCITPSLFDVLLDYVRSSNLAVVPEAIWVGGEGLHMTTVDAFESLLGSKGCVLFNLYGTTETGDSAVCRLDSAMCKALKATGLPYCPIGLPRWNIDIIVEEDEIIVSNVGVPVRRYLGDPETTAKQWCELGWRSKDKAEHVDLNGERLLICAGRLDACVKIRGFKVDLLAIEECVRSRDCVVNVAACHDSDENKLILFVVPKDPALDLQQLKVLPQLPQSHHPQIVCKLKKEDFCLLRTSKADKQSLMKAYYERKHAERGDFVPDSTKNRTMDTHTWASKVAKVWQSIFPLWKNEDWDADFWDLGGHSLGAIKMCGALGVPAKYLLSGKLSTPRSFCDWLSLQTPPATINETSSPNPGSPPPGKNKKVAVIGYSGRWPGIGQTTIDNLFHSLGGEVPFEPVSSPPRPRGIGNIKQGFYLDEDLIRGFDCAMWGVRAEDVMLWDPHLRMFLEMCYEALTDAGMQPRLGRQSSPIDCGVFASGGSLGHFLDELTRGESLADIRVRDPQRYFALECGTENDYLAMKTSHLFNLTGPSQVIQTACSSALVSVATAVEAIRAGNCNTALAGGISLVLPQEEHAYAEGMIWSQDGRCRPFDAAANGTANCNGGGVFVLKDLDQALADGDPIYGTISGVAVRNDGGKKDFTSPSIEGHTATIQQALADAMVTPSRVSMVEAHATGTYVGDPIEIEALCEAYGGPRSGGISLGSHKGNVGHANTAAGAMGLAKVMMCVSRGVLVPSGNFEKLNPLIEAKLAAEENLFKVQTNVCGWPNFTSEEETNKRIAGISALGIGGTNAHVIVEESSRDHKQDENNVANGGGGEPLLDWHLCFSANSAAAAKMYAAQLQSYLKASLSSDTERASTASACLRDLSYTLSTRDLDMPFRVCASVDDISHVEPVKQLPSTSLVLLFPGQGISLPGLSSDFQMHPNIVAAFGGCPLAQATATRTAVDKQVAQFAVQYSTAMRTLELLQLNDDDRSKLVVCGHSLGEWAAAAVAGAIGVAFALECVRKRAELLLKHTKEGAMAAVAAKLSEVEQTLRTFPNVEVACINRSDRITITGAQGAVQAFVQDSGLSCTMLNVDGAFHSKLAEPAATELAAFMQASLEQDAHHCGLQKPELQWISSATGGFVTTPTTPAFWMQQTRGRVLFAGCVDVLVAESRTNELVFIDVGPGGVARSFVKDVSAPCVCVLSKDKVDLASFRMLWSLGVNSVKSSLNIPTTGKRLLSLPHYTWDRINCWYDEHDHSIDSRNQQTSGNDSNLFYREGWQKQKLDEHDNDNHSNQSTLGVVPYLVLGGSVDVSVWLPDCLTVECSSLDKRALQQCVAKFGNLVVFQGFTCPKGSVPDVQIENVAQTIEVIKALIDAKVSLRRCVFVLAPSRLMAGCIGALRCASNERPELKIKICIARSSPQSLEPLLISHHLASNYEFRLISEKDLEIRQVIALPSFGSSKGKSGIQVEASGTYIVTGGLGGLGKLVVQWLIEEMHVRRVLILTRRKGCKLGLASNNCDVRVVSCDISSISGFKAMLVAQAIPAEEITGVFHCAGVVFDCLVQNAPTDQSELREHMGAKVCGIETLLQCTSEHTWLALFSSTSSALGPPGQVTYCAANAALDMCMGMDPEAQAMGRKVVSLQWGGWSSNVKGNMSDRYNIKELAQCERFLTAQAGMQALRAALSAGLSTVMIADIYCWPRYISSLQLQEAPLLDLMPSPTIFDRWVPSEVQMWVPSEAQLAQPAQLSRFLWMRDHNVNNVPVLPASYLLEVLSARSNSLLNVRFSNLAYVGRWLQTEVSKCESQLLLWSTPFQGPVDVKTNPAICHSTAQLEKHSTGELSAIGKVLLNLYRSNIQSWTPCSADTVYESFRRSGFNYGPAFALVRQIWVSGTLLVASVDDNTSGFSCELATSLDACMHACVAMCPNSLGAVPVSVDRFSVLTTDLNDLSLPDGGGSAGWISIMRVSPKDVGMYDETVDMLDVLAVRTSDGLTVLLEGLKLKLLTLPDAGRIRLFEGCFEKFEPQSIQAGNAGQRPRANESIVTDNVQEWLSLRRRWPNCQVVCSQGNNGTVGDVERSAWYVAGRALTFKPLETQQVASAQVPNDSQPFMVKMTSDLVCNCVPLRPERLKELAAPGAGNVAVEVLTWGLNFLDVLAVSGVMPSEHFGGECVGVVTSAGAGVTHLKVGDRVGAVCLGGFASHIVLPAHFCHVVPALLSDEEAATIPVAYLTAWLALRWHARATSEDRVLVHNASGGVGLACLNLLRDLGCAQITATCSTNKNKKVQVLREHGIERESIFNSKDVASWEVGAGKMDVVVGALFGDSMKASLNVLNPMGRIIDIGKREQSEGGSLDLAPFLRGLTYTSAHLDALMVDGDPALLRKLNDSVWRNVGEGVRPLPLVKYELAQIGDAMKYLMSGQHVGKVVVRMPRQSNSPFSKSESTSGESNVAHKKQPNGLTLKTSPCLNDFPGFVETLTATVARLHNYPSICLTHLSISNPHVDVDRSDDAIDGESDRKLQPEAANVAITCLMEHGESCRLIEVDPAILLNGLSDGNFYTGICEKILASAQSTRHLIALGPSSGSEKLPGSRTQAEWGALLSDLGAGNKEPELSWLLGEIARLLRGSKHGDLPEDELGDLTLEELGFDSLARLQLLHSMKKHFPSTSTTDLPGNMALKQFCGGQEEAPAPKWLVLHGFRTNAAIVAQQVGFLRSVLGCEFEFIEAPIPCRGELPPGLTTQQHGEVYEWWYCDEQADSQSYDTGWCGSQGLSTSLGYLDDFVSRRASPFAGVIGFSQGGAMACWLASKGFVDKAILFSPVNPANSAIDVASLPIPTKVSTAIIYDPIADSQAKNFVDWFEKVHGQSGQASQPVSQSVSQSVSQPVGQSASQGTRFKLWTHNAKHTIPSNTGDTAQLYQEVNEFLMCDQQNTQ